MSKLSRIEVAAIKRTASNVKGMRKKKAKLELKITELSEELESLNLIIDKWEAPVKMLTGGLTSEEYLQGNEGDSVIGMEDSVVEESEDNTSLQNDSEEEPWI